MAKVSTNISLEPELKEQAQRLFKDMGMDLTTAITIFLRQSVREKAIPFTIRCENYNRETILALAEYEDMKNQPEKYKRYKSFQEAMNEVLDA